MALKCQPIRQQDAQHPLGIELGLPLGSAPAVHDCGDTAIAIARPLVDDPTDQRRRASSSGLAVVAHASRQAIAAACPRRDKLIGFDHLAEPSLSRTAPLLFGPAAKCAGS